MPETTSVRVKWTEIHVAWFRANRDNLGHGLGSIVKTMGMVEGKPIKPSAWLHVIREDRW